MQIDFTTILIAFFGLLGALFGSQGFWTWFSNRKNKVHAEELVNSCKKMSGDIETLKEQYSSINNDIKELKLSDEKAIEYRRAREIADKKAQAERLAIIGAQKDLMRERLVNNARECIKKGYYDESERETFHALYERYVNEPYKGNGVVHQFAPILINLPWAPPTEKEEEQVS